MILKIMIVLLFKMDPISMSIEYSPAVFRVFMHPYPLYLTLAYNLLVIVL